MKRPVLIDAQQMAGNHPATFDAPACNELAAIMPGDFVKVCSASKSSTDGTERFWVEVLAISDSALVGRIDNDLILTHLHGLRCDDQIEFEQHHIFQIFVSPTSSFSTVVH